MDKTAVSTRGVLLIPVAALALMIAFLPSGQWTFDLSRFLVPWMGQVRAQGVSSISGEFSNYSPPYIYLMYLASWLVPLVGTIPAIKLICLPFVLLTARILYSLILLATGSRDRALLCAACFTILPTPFINSFGWGQCDIIYTSFLTAFVLFAARERPALACAMFGVALSFKLQAIFLTPVLFYLLLRRVIGLRHLLLIPASYIAMLVPAAIAGRPWSELIAVYYYQAHYVPSLATGVANPWIFLRDFVDYASGVVLGLSAGIAASVALPLYAGRLRATPTTILLVAAAVAAIIPYVLPKMHERYFFAAEVLTFALAFALPRYWVAAVLFQLGSIGAYSFFANIDLTARAGLLAVTLALAILLFALREMRMQAAEASEGVGSKPDCQT